MMNGYYGNMGWGGWMVMGVIMVAFWGLVIFAVISLFRSTTSPSPSRPNEADPQQILDERLARGDIDAADYQARRTALREGTGGRR
jgi:putative membrane protein